MFLCHFPSGRPAWALPSALPCGARTFLVPPSANRGRLAHSISILPHARRLRVNRPHCPRQSMSHFPEQVPRASDVTVYGCPGGLAQLMQGMRGVILTAATEPMQVEM